jgi:hypothetical protein
MHSENRSALATTRIVSPEGLDFLAWSVFSIPEPVMNIYASPSVTLYSNVKRWRVEDSMKCRPLDVTALFFRHFLIMLIRIEKEGNGPK